MLLNSGYDATACHGQQALGYNTVETLLEDVSRSMAASNLTRKYSRGSNGHRAGSSMRGVVKATSSASNSPRSSMLGRRKTLMTDAYRRRPQMMEQTMMAPETLSTYDGLQAPLKTSRPLSWHPSSQMAPHTAYQQYSVPQIPNFEAPTPAVYSGYTSPSSTFSPSSRPILDFQQEQPYQYLDESSFFPATTHDTSSNYMPYQPSALQRDSDYQNLDYGNPAETMDLGIYSPINWNNFVANGFSNVTAPPTPENFLPIQHPSPQFDVSEPPTYALDDLDDGEEPLISIGLYDKPEKSPASDPHLDNYRAQMMAQLLGHSYRQPQTEPTGKGLKLEETWEPPASENSDDDDNDEEDGDADADGSVTDEVELTTGAAVLNEHQSSNSVTNGWL